MRGRERKSGKVIETVRRNDRVTERGREIRRALER